MRRIIIILFSLILLSCSLFNTEKDKNDIFQWISIPTKGMKFIYSYDKNYYDSLRNPYYSVSGYSVNTITDFQQDSQELFVTFEESIYVVGDDNIPVCNYSYNHMMNTYYTSRRDYMFEFYSIGVIEIWDNNVIIQTPVEVSTRWYWPDNTKLEIIEINAHKTVEAGNFDDVVVIMRKAGNDTIGEIWYSPEAGNFIKFMTNTYDKLPYVDLELKEIVSY